MSVSTSKRATNKNTTDNKKTFNITTTTSTDATAAAASSSEPTQQQQRRKLSSQKRLGNNWKGEYVPSSPSSVGMMTRSRSVAAAARSNLEIDKARETTVTATIRVLGEVQQQQQLQQQGTTTEQREAQLDHRDTAMVIIDINEGGDSCNNSEEEEKSQQEEEKQETITEKEHHETRFSLPSTNNIIIIPSVASVATSNEQATTLKMQRTQASPIRRRLPKRSKADLVPPNPRTHLLRLRTVNHGRRLPTSTAERMDWKGADGKRLQDRYDAGPYAKYIPRAVKSIWKAAVKVRRQLQKQGVNQTPLCRGKSALSKVQGIIYAVVAKGQSNVYVGQTIHSALHRFGGHVNHARTEQETPLHVHIQKEGIRDIYLIPLELIPVNRYRDANGKQCSTMFRTVASVRERYWIERLHSYIPRGSNVEWSARRRHRKRHKPMKWAVERQKKNKMNIIKEMETMKQSQPSQMEPDTNQDQLAEEVAITKKGQEEEEEDISKSQGDDQDHYSIDDLEVRSTDTLSDFSNDSVLDSYDPLHDNSNLNSDKALGSDYSSFSPDPSPPQSSGSPLAATPTDLFLPGDSPGPPSISTAESISTPSDHSYASTKSRDKVGVGTDDTYSYRQFGYRNWLRRCRHLILLHETNKARLGRHALTCFQKYASRNLWKMVNFLEHEETHGFTLEAVQAVTSLIRNYLQVRKRDPPTVKRVGSTTISVEWTSQLLRAVPLRRIMMSEASQELFPATNVKLLTDVSVVRKLVKPFGRSVFNYGKTARQLPSCSGSSNDSTYLGGDCTCRELFDEKFRPKGECVHTGDLNIVQSQSLRMLMLMGSKLRVYMSANPMDAIRSALEEYISKVSQQTSVPKIAFNGWRQCIVAACEKHLPQGLNVHQSPRILSRPSQRDRSTTSTSKSVSVVTLQPNDRKYLQFLQHHLVMVPVDKAANNVAVICKRLYMQTLFQELNSSNEAVKSNITVPEGTAVVAATDGSDDSESEGIQLRDSEPQEMDQVTDLETVPAPSKEPIPVLTEVPDAVVSVLTAPKTTSKQVVYGVVKSRTKESIVAEHLLTMEKTYLLKETPDCLAYLYWTPKLHKVPASQRFIAAAFACTSTALSKILSDCLTTVMHKLREKDDDHIRRTGVRRYFIVDGYEEVAAFLNRWPRRTSSSSRGGHRSLQTGDFSTMYTTIPHEDLTKRVKQVVNEAWEWEASKHQVTVGTIALMWTADHGGTCKWFTSRSRENPPLHTAKSQKLTKEVFHKMVKWLVDNIYLVNGETCRRQEIGIPMGTNCAPALANLYLYSYESEYIDKLLANEELERARSFHMTFRLIDDVLSVDNPHFRQAIAGPYEMNGIYPAALALNDTSISEEEVHFLGMTIRSDPLNGKLILDVFDKRREFPFIVCRYPHKQSLLPSFIAYGVFVGLLHRYYRICTAFDGFCENAALLANTLINQGWQRHRLRAHFRNFLMTRIRLKWKMTIKQCCDTFVKQTQISEVNQSADEGGHVEATQ